MSANPVPKRKSRSEPHQTSALDALRASGLVGMFAGAPELASSRKRMLRAELRGKTGTTR